jgi:hypothetical protein
MLFLRDAPAQPVAQLGLRPRGVLGGELNHRLLELLHQADTAPIAHRHFFWLGAHDVAPMDEAR